MSIAAISENILSEPNIEGITISGGEPFLQARVLAQLIKKVREKQDFGMIVYTGYTFEHLKGLIDKGNGEIQDLLQITDLLVSGPYVRGLDDGLCLRGSSNQVVMPLTDRYSSWVKRNLNKKRREVEVHILEKELMLVGIPGKGILKKWQERSFMK